MQRSKADRTHLHDVVEQAGNGIEGLVAQGTLEPKTIQYCHSLTSYRSKPTLSPDAKEDTIEREEAHDSLSLSLDGRSWGPAAARNTLGRHSLRRFAL